MNPMTREAVKRLEDFTERIMEEEGARGIAVGIVNSRGQIQYENYFGFRDEKKGLPINQDTIFGMASVTKSFTALSIMQMQEEGILSVDDPVKAYIPEFTNKNQGDLVRIRHLLSHSGGYFPLPRIVVDKTAEEMGIEDSFGEELIYREDFAAEGIKRVAGRLDEQTSFTGRPGQRLSYCNDGFGLLSDIVRRHGDCGSFAQYLEKHILAPLDMNRSNISFIRNSSDDNAAVLYSLENGVMRGDRNYQNDAFVLHGGGGMKSTLGDMLKYGAMYLNEGTGANGKKIARRYSIEEMTKPRQFMKPGVYYGYGLETKQFHDITVVEHGGSLPGVSSNFSFSPQAEAAVVVLCNTMDIPVYAIADLAMKAYCGLDLEEEHFSHRSRTWTAREVRELAGNYANGEGDSFSLTIKEGRTLSMEVNGKPVELTPVYPWQGMVRKKYSDVYLTAVRDEEGKVFAARYGSRIFPKMQ